VEKDTCEVGRDEREDAWTAIQARLQAEIANLEEERSLLDSTLTRRETEIARLKESLQKQVGYTKAEQDAKDRYAEQEERALRKAAELAERVQRLEAELHKVNGQKGELEDQKAELTRQASKTQQEASDAATIATMAEAKVESITKMHEEYRQKSEQLRTGQIGTAIQSKLELHISVPHVVLTYNNAPPLTVSTAIGLSKAKILKFLDDVLFPYFEPLWVCLDGVDKAPDGTNKKRYSGRMLERLTDSIKDFIEKSQLGEVADLTKTTYTEKCMEDKILTKSCSGFKGLGSLRTPSR
jgi:hypothetical protein